MIDKTELLRMIMETNSGQSPAYVLEQYAVYLKGLDSIHSGSNISTTGNTACETEMDKDVRDSEIKKDIKNSLTCGFTKRKLVIKPEDAISNDSIACCICGKEGQAITSRHLASHNGLTPEGYKKLCGYSSEQPLMANNHYTRMKKNALKAQEARKKKKRVVSN